jgi:hypothetical protein
MQFLLLSFLLFSVSAGAASVPTNRVEKIRGEVYLVKGKKKVLILNSETPLKAGDVVITGKDASLRVVAGKVVADLASDSAVKFSGGLQVLYGQVLVGVKKPSEAPMASGKKSKKKKTVQKKSWVTKLTLPTAVVETEGGEFLVNIVRDEAEFGRRAAGNTERAPPLLEVLALKKSPKLYSQVGVLDGVVGVKPAKSERLALHAGEMTRIRGSQGDYAAVPVGLDQLKALRSRVGFND